MPSTGRLIGALPEAAAVAIFALTYLVLADRPAAGLLARPGRRRPGRREPDGGGRRAAARRCAQGDRLRYDRPAAGRDDRRRQSAAGRLFPAGECLGRHPRPLSDRPVGGRGSGLGSALGLSGQRHDLPGFDAARCSTSSTRLRRNPVPYLLAVAMASNIGSTATITGNPQNMIIGSLSHIPYSGFAAALSPIAGIGLALAVALIAVTYRRGILDASEAARGPAAGAAPIGRSSSSRWRCRSP